MKKIIPAYLLIFLCSITAIAQKPAQQKKNEQPAKNMVSGRVIDTLGGPAETSVFLISIGDGSGFDLGPHRRTSKEGMFKFENIEPGRYILSIKPFETRSFRQPYAATFYPGSSSRQNAGIITIGAESVIEGLEMVVPDPEIITLSGTVVYEDGSPAAGATVRFAFDDFKSHTELSTIIETTTDEKGSFKLKVIKGVRAAISAELKKKDYVECPELHELVFGAFSSEIRTKAEVFESTTERTGIELILAAPPCRP